MTDPKYGNRHQQERARLAEIVAAGLGYCCETVCLNPGGRWIPPVPPGVRPGDWWHLAHTDDGRSYKGPAHAACNLSEAGRRGNPRGRKKRKTGRPVRTWRPTRAW